MTEHSAPKTKNRKICFLTEQKILIPGILLMLLTGIILFAVLLLLSFGKIHPVMESRTNWLVQSAEKADASSTNAINNLLRHYSGVLKYLVYYQSHAEIDDKELESYANSVFDTVDFYVYKPDGTYAFPEEKEELSRDVAEELEALFELREPLESSRNSIGHLLFYPLQSGNYLTMYIMDEQIDRRLINASLTSVVSSLRYYDNDDRTDDHPTSFAFICYSGPDPNISSIMDSDSVYELDPNDGSSYKNQKGEVFDFTVVKINSLDFLGTDDYDLCTVKYNGRLYYAMTKEIMEAEGVQSTYYYCMDVFSELPTILHILIYVMLGFFLILAVVILFIYYLRQYREIQKEINSDYVSDEKRKTRILPVIGVVAVGLFTFYAQTLFSLSVYVLEDSQNLKEIREIYNDAVKDTANTKTEVKTMYLECVQSVSDLLRSSPDLGNRENLLEICSLLGLKAVILYDAEGVMTVSTGDYSGLKFGTKETDDRYQFNQLKNGYPYVALDPQKNKETGEMTQQFAVHLYDRSGSISGFMEIVCLTEQLVNVENGESIRALLENIAIPGISQAACIDPETRKVIYYPDSDYIDWPADDLGFTEESMKSGYFGKIRLLDNLCYVQNSIIGDKLVYVITQESMIYKNRIPFALLSVSLFLIDFFILLYTIREKRKGYDEVVYVSEKTYHEIRELAGEYRQRPDDSAESGKEAKEAAVSRLSYFRQSWLMMTPEKRTAVIIKVLWGISAVMILLLVVIRMAFQSNNNLLMRIISGDWPRGINVFSVTACFLLILIGTVAVGFVL